tara:strand:+ start:1280 stop:1651 length:372 start_codon:yes stop_codon:yes gene_type:complete
LGRVKKDTVRIRKKENNETELKLLGKNLMKNFYILILTLILISCNEKNGYSEVSIEYGDIEKVISESECRNVVEKGKILSTFHDPQKHHSFIFTRILHKGQIYMLLMDSNGHTCNWKRKFHDK